MNLSYIETEVKMYSDEIKLETESNKNYINKFKKGFYSVLTQCVLLACVFVSVAVSQANRSTGDFRPATVILPMEEIEVKQIHEALKGHPSKYKTHGIDVARYQKQINWPMVKKAGVEFVFIKATEGVGLKDSFFEANWKKAGDAGVRRGAYHFYIAEKDPKLQAANFIYNTQLQAGDLPPVLDVEVTRGMSGKVIREGVQVWLDMVEKAYNKRPIIYTGYHFYNKYLQGHFNDYPLWIAHYNSADHVKLDREWLFWQHTDKGKLAGIPKEVDLNVFTGSPADLDSMCIPAKPKSVYNFVMR